MNEPQPKPPTATPAPDVLEKSYPRMTLRISKELLGRVKSVAAAKGWSLSQVATTCMKEKLPELEEAAKAGLT